MKSLSSLTSKNKPANKEVIAKCKEVATQTMLNMGELDRIMLMFLCPRAEACTQTEGNHLEELPVFDSNLIHNDFDMSGLHSYETMDNLISEPSNESQKGGHILSAANNDISDTVKHIHVHIPSHKDSIHEIDPCDPEKKLHLKEKEPKTTPSVSRSSKRLALKKDAKDSTSSKIKCQQNLTYNTKQKSLGHQPRKITDRSKVNLISNKKPVTRTSSIVKSEPVCDVLSIVKTEPEVHVNVYPSKKNKTTEPPHNENHNCNNNDVSEDNKSCEQNSLCSVDSKNRKHVCSICSRTFRDSHDLMRHKRIHTNEKPYQCPECSQSFRWKASYLTHHHRIHNKSAPKSTPKIKAEKMNIPEESNTDQPIKEEMSKRKGRISKGKSTYECQYCGKILRCLAHLKRHNLIHTGKRPFKCNQCVRAFSERSGLKNHILRKHSEKEFDCDLCGKHFGSRVFLKQHKKVHTKQRQEFVCKLCEKVYTTLIALDIHMRAHSGLKPFVCDICGRRLYSKYQLNRHVKHHYALNAPPQKKTNKPKCHVCNVCSKAFGSSSHLMRHISTVHSTIKDRHCPTCNKQFSSVGAMKKHMKEHNEGPYQCQVCERWWLTKETFKAHMQLHFGRTSSKVFVCVHCNIGFFLMIELDDHYKSHDENIPFKCVHCEKKFEKEAELVSHRSVHPNQSVPLNCDRCDKLFATLQELNAHLHSHEHPFECVVCDLKFSNEDETNEHMQLHIDDGSILSSTVLAYKCPQCGKVFSSKGDYELHINVHNGAEFICTLCDFAFESETSLQDHCKIHSVIKVEENVLKHVEECESQILKQQGNNPRIQVCDQDQVKSIVNLDAPAPVETMESLIQYETTNEDDLSVCQTVHVGDGSQSISCTVCGKTFFLIENFLNHCQDHPEIEVTVKTI